MEEWRSVAKMYPYPSLRKHSRNQTVMQTKEKANKANKIEVKVIEIVSF